MMKNMTNVGTSNAPNYKQKVNFQYKPSEYDQSTLTKHQDSSSSSLYNMFKSYIIQSQAAFLQSETASLINLEVQMGQLAT